MSIKIVIADDHSLFAESLANNMKNHGDFEFLKLLKNGRELLEALKFNQPDIVFLDYNMPELNGYETAKEILKSYPEMKILVITMHSSLSIVNPLIKLGVKGVVLKNSSTSEVVLAVDHLISGKTYFSQEIITNLTKGFNSGIQFTKREKELINLLKEGMSTKEIADKLCLSTHTIESHRKNLLAKTDSHNTQAMLKRIEEEGLM